MALLAVQGPRAMEMMQKLTDTDLSIIPYYSFATARFAGVENVIISNTGYTGAGGFELYFYPEEGDKIWDALFEAGDAYGIKPIGLGARDTLRLEMGFCLYGNDLDDTTSPCRQDGLDHPLRKNSSLGVESERKSRGHIPKLCCFELTEREFTAWL